MYKNKKATAFILVFIASSLFSNEVVFSPENIKDETIREDATLMTEVLILNSERIGALEKKIAKIESIIEKKSITNDKTQHYEPNAKVSNVKKYAHLREKPWGKIKSFLPLHTQIHIIECNKESGGIVWCEISNFSGGYISKALTEEM